VSDAQAPALRVWFSPLGGCTAALCAAIAKANHRIRVQSYQFRSQPLAVSLLQAHARGVDVEVLLDASDREMRDSQSPLLIASGLAVLIDARHSIAHNKLALIDEDQVWTGSFNYTVAAEYSNAENLLCITHGPTAQLYQANYAGHREHADPR
jgi:phosphatidylserine/phosphatidylglycerophosphate/cardiolipin synthase-like enzyme